MNELLNKLSSYNVFNYLFPGAVFAYIIDSVTPHKLVQNDIVVTLFFYYFIGLIISRIGSIIIEPVITGEWFAPHAKYEDYLSALDMDESIATLSEQNNMYRTIISLMFTIIGVLIYDWLVNAYLWIDYLSTYIILGILIILFLLAYKKQTAYIVKRVNQRISK